MRTTCSFIFFISTLFIARFLHADGLTLQHAIGGQATSLEIAQGYWYQSLGDRLIVLDKQGGEIITTVILTSYPAEALCTDLLVNDQQLFALLYGREVVVLDLSDPRVPKIVERITASQLGIFPRDFVMVGSSPTVIGGGGAVRLSDGHMLVQCECNVTGVANSTEHGIVYTSNRRIYDADSHEFMGSATQLFELDAKANVDVGTLVYARALDGQTEIGLMTPNMRDINTTDGKVILEGALEEVAVRGSRTLVATDAGLYVLSVSPKELRLLRHFPMKGVQDLGVIASNYFAVCGHFGYGVFRIDADQGGDAGTLFRSVRSNGSFSAGVFDRNGVYIPTKLGTVYYGYDRSFQYEGSPSKEIEAPTRAVILGWEATIDAESGDILITNARTSRHRLKLLSHVNTVVSISGVFWFGTDDGIYIYGIDQQGFLNELGSLELAGPIVQIIPRFNGSAVFISGAGFAGVVTPSY